MSFRLQNEIQKLRKTNPSMTTTDSRHWSELQKLYSDQGLSRTAETVGLKKRIRITVPCIKEMMMMMMIMIMIIIIIIIIIIVISCINSRNTTTTNHRQLKTQIRVEAVPAPNIF
jgi:uncharacterized membrane protein YvbJ